MNKNKYTVVVALANTNAVADDQKSAASVTVYKQTEDGLVPVQMFYAVEETTNKTATAYTALCDFANWFVDQSYGRADIPVEIICTDLNTNTSLMKFARQYASIASHWMVIKQMIDREVDKTADRYYPYFTRMFSSGRVGSPEVTRGQVVLIDILMSIVRTAQPYAVFCPSLKLLRKDEQYTEHQKLAKHDTAQLIQQLGWGNKIKGRDFDKKTDA